MTTNEAEAYPLAWPLGRPRTPAGKRKRARFERTQDRARRDIVSEIHRAGGKSIVISTNCELRRDGFPRSDRRPPDDPGVAVYFTDRKGKSLCIACDQWSKVEDNMTAIACTVEAMRGIERWGGQQASDQAFSGFAALPPASHHRTGQPWHRVFNCQPDADRDTVDSLYRQLAKERHPDRGGSNELMDELSTALKEFYLARGL